MFAATLDLYKKPSRMNSIIAALLVTVAIAVLSAAVAIYFSNAYLDKTEVPVPTDYRNLLRGLAKFNSHFPQPASKQGLLRTTRLAKLLVNTNKPGNRPGYLKDDLSVAHRLLLKYAYQYPDLDADLKMELAIERLVIFNRLQFWAITFDKKILTEDAAVYVKQNLHTLHAKDSLIVARRELITSRILEELPIADLMQMPELMIGTPAYDERLHWAFAKCARSDLAEVGSQEMSDSLARLEKDPALLTYLAVDDLIFPMALVEFLGSKMSLCENSLLRFFKLIGATNARNS